MHANTVYGIASKFFAPLIGQIIEKLQVADLLDYGCGSRLTLLKSLRVNHRFRYKAYDPGVPEYAGTPSPSQMVACVDVLEHIEPDMIENVLDDLQRLTQEVGFYSVSTEPAEKMLPDGRNAHLIIQEPQWWLERMLPRFDLQTFQVIEGGFYVIVHPKRRIHATVNV
jgi:hypothetical protein